MLVVLRFLVVQECDGGEWGWSWLSNNALIGVSTSDVDALHVLRCGEGNVIPWMQLVGQGRLQGTGGGGAGGRLKAA